MAGVRKYVERATIMGGHWIRKNPLTDMTELFWMESGYEEEFQKEWTIREIAELEEPKQS